GTTALEIADELAAAKQHRDDVVLLLQAKGDVVGDDWSARPRCFVNDEQNRFARSVETPPIKRKRLRDAGSTTPFRPAECNVMSEPIGCGGSDVGVALPVVVRIEVRGRSESHFLANQDVVECRIQISKTSGSRRVASGIEEGTRCDGGRR